MLEVFWLFVWVGCAVASSAIVSDKGQSGCLGFLVGAIFGPIGIIIALLVPKAESVQNEKKPECKLRKCPRCAELIQLDAVFCRFCGTEVGPWEPPETRAPEVVLRSSKAIPTPQELKKQGRMWFAFVLVAVLFFGAVMYGAWKVDQNQVFKDVEVVGDHTDGALLELISWSWRVEDGMIVAEGVVKNIHSKSLGRVNVLLSLFDKDGEVVGADETFLMKNTLYSKQRSTFKIVTKEVLGVEKAAVDFFDKELEPIKWKMSK